jgi:transcriptional regulator with XRE-family HTH domain
MKKWQNLGEWLQAKLDFYGWKPLDLARAIKVSPTLVYMYLYNTRSPSRDTMEAILQVFGLDCPESLRRRVELELKPIYKPFFTRKRGKTKFKDSEELLDEQLNKFEFVDF